MLLFFFVHTSTIFFHRRRSSLRLVLDVTRARNLGTRDTAVPTLRLRSHSRSSRRLRGTPRMRDHRVSALPPERISCRTFRVHTIRLRETRVVQDLHNRLHIFRQPRRATAHGGLVLIYYRGFKFFNLTVFFFRIISINNCLQINPFDISI